VLTGHPCWLVGRHQRVPILTRLALDPLALIRHVTRQAEHRVADESAQHLLRPTCLALTPGPLIRAADGTHHILLSSTQVFPGNQTASSYIRRGGGGEPQPDRGCHPPVPRRKKRPGSFGGGSANIDDVYEAGERDSNAADHFDVLLRRHRAEHPGATLAAREAWKPQTPQSCWVSTGGNRIPFGWSDAAAVDRVPGVESGRALPQGSGTPLPRMPRRVSGFNTPR